MKFEIQVFNKSIVQNTVTLQLAIFLLTNNTNFQKQKLLKMQCKYHQFPIKSIQQPSLRPLCEKCINQNEGQKKYRLQQMRAQLQKDFNRQTYFQKHFSTVKQLEVEKIKLDKLIELFVGKNMTQAKKLINKRSLEAQKVIQTAIERQLKSGNEQLRNYTDSLLQPYSSINQLTEISELHLHFDQEFLDIEEKVQNKKKQIKKNVIQKIKEDMRNFYAQFFDF